jgi:hypothetical protein
MFFIFGLSTKLYRLGAPILRCRNCGNTVAQVTSRRVTRFTLFFIPLFPVRIKYGMQCTACGSTSDLSHGEVDRLAAR